LLTGETRLVGLLGRPVAGSLSPRMQNAAFSARGLDLAYVALAVEPPRLEAAVAGLVALGYAGANVTIPFKTAVVSFCDELDETAERAGSVNTLVIEDGRVRGSTTDGLAVANAVDAAGAHVLLLGAGGAGQAVGTALLDAGAARLTIAGRRAERAHALDVRLRSLFPDRAVDTADEWPPPAGAANVVVNATPVVDDPLVELGPEHAVVDLAYLADGRATALADTARERGCDVVDGLDVLVAQGAASFERWTGVPAPLDVMRAAVRPA
jgi:shikimate dehydrogenase